ncbi:MAG TPA: hypothetical protein PKC30_02650 [Saprospiraceae bacterium]|mgnify:CR=1 FL=1|nr:hypothetical protein [Saprospiraceae bacterium]
MEKIRVCTNGRQRTIVKLDAGIATEENLELLIVKAYDYICVSRITIHDYLMDPIMNIQQIISESKQTNYNLLKVQREGKLKKEESMNNQFEDILYTGGL